MFGAESETILSTCIEVTAVLILSECISYHLFLMYIFILCIKLEGKCRKLQEKNQNTKFLYSIKTKCDKVQ